MLTIDYPFEHGGRFGKLNRMTKYFLCFINISRANLVAFIREDKRSQKVQLGPKIEIRRIPRK